MKKLLLASAIASTFVLPTMVNAADYKIDTDGAHASVNFKVSHLGYSFIQGRFNTFSGNFSYDANNVEASKISVTVDTTSLDSNHAERDKHIKGDQFINAGKFSNSTFESKKVVKNADGGLSVMGALTLHGITKDVTLDAKFIGEGDDPWGGYRAGFEATTRLQLKDFGITVVGASSYVDLDLQVEGIKQ
ncbi:YceI family protein [Psychromonas sp. KJ10-10]|uniref:YceI family protein n=1 Tax=Psychromonas sp. KJ10-10 TaxID=3391823 RepID=UPI0039B62511